LETLLSRPSGTRVRGRDSVGHEKGAKRGRNGREVFAPRSGSKQITQNKEIAEEPNKREKWGEKKRGKGGRAKKDNPEQRKKPCRALIRTTKRRTEKAETEMFTPAGPCFENTKKRNSLKEKDSNSLDRKE